MPRASAQRRARKNARAGQVPSTLTKRKKVRKHPAALMIVDVQQAFPIPPDLVERIRRYARRFDCRVFTQFVNRPHSLFRRSLGQDSCKPGSADTRLLITPAPGDLVIVKGGYGLPPSAVRRLKRRGIREIKVCGVDTDACVLGVMFSLFDAGITCRAKLDHCWSSTGLHAAARRIIRAQFPGSR